MVKGLDRFREYFAGHEDGYALIGGAACDILFGEAGLPFRATKDFDIVLCVEVVSVEFGTVFSLIDETIINVFAIRFAFGKIEKSVCF